MTRQYWTYIRDEEKADLEMLTKQEAQEFANEEFAQEMDDAGEHSGTEEIELICFEYDEEGDYFMICS